MNDEASFDFYHNIGIFKKEIIGQSMYGNQEYTLWQTKQDQIVRTVDIMHNLALTSKRSGFICIYLRLSKIISNTATLWIYQSNIGKNKHSMDKQKLNELSA